MGAEPLPRRELSGAIGGGIYLRPMDGMRPAHRLRLLSPRWVRWDRWRRAGDRVGEEPEKHVDTCYQLPEDDPEAPGWWVLPRFAPVEGRFLDRTAEGASLPGATVDPGERPLPYQRRAVSVWLQHGSGVVVAPDGAGKALIGLLAVERAQAHALILVRSVARVERWVERVRARTAGVIGFGRDEREAPIVVASAEALRTWTWRKLYGWGRRFGVVIVDELQRCDVERCLWVLGALPGRRRLGLSSVPARPDGLSVALHWALGPVVHRVGHEDLQAAGCAPLADVRWVHTGCAPEKGCGAGWADGVASLAANPVRNRLIVRAVAAEVVAGRHVLLVATGAVHATRLASWLRSMRIPALELHGELHRCRRRGAVAAAERGSAQVLVTTKAAALGWTLPTPVVVVMAAVGGRSGPASPPDGDPDPRVVDLVDDWTSGLDCARARARAYRALGMPGANDLERGAWR